MDFMNPLAALPTLHPALIAVILLWSLIWKGLALWRAAGRGQKYWFAALLVINTLGIFEIIYLIATRKPAAAPQV